MTFRQLEYICAIVAEGSISKAAKKLFISQSALSQQLNLLESEYQTKLFNRTTMPITLTEDGRLYYDNAVKILKIKEEMDNQIKYKRGEVLNVKTLPFYTSTMVASIFSNIRHLFPNTEFKVHEAIATELFRTDASENIDIYIHTFETAPVIPEGYNKDIFKHDVIGREGMVLAVAKNNPIIDRLGQRIGTSGMPVANLNLLHNEIFTSSIVSGQQQSITKKVCNQYGGFDPISINMQTTYLQILGLLRFTGYISILPDTVQKFSTIQTDIIFYEIEGCETTRNIYASYHKDSRLSAAAIAFIKSAQKEYLT